MDPRNRRSPHRCIKLQFGGEEAQNEAWSWLADNQLSSVVNTKESRLDVCPSDTPRLCYMLLADPFSVPHQRHR